MELEKLNREFMIQVNQDFWYLVLGEFPDPEWRVGASLLLAMNN